MQDTERNDNKSKLLIDVLILGLSIVLLVVFKICGMIVAVEGDSMYPTFQEKDLLYISKVSNYDYGDIVIIDNQSLGKVIIKRVIANEGDTVEIDGSSVFVNDELITEDYVDSDWSSYYERDTVPKGCVFVLGDNRGVSLDSRGLGYIEKDTIIGVYKFKLN